MSDLAPGPVRSLYSDRYYTFAQPDGSFQNVAGYVFVCADCFPRTETWPDTTRALFVVADRAPAVAVCWFCGRPFEQER